MVKCQTERVLSNSYWITCPVCGRKLALCAQGVKVSGVFVRCRKCHEEVELKTPKSRPGKL